MAISAIYYTYDTDKTPESNISRGFDSIFSWLNGLGGEVSTGLGHLDAISTSLSTLSTSANNLVMDQADTNLALKELVKAVKGMSPQDLNDQAIDAMRRELAHLVVDNARMKRELKERQTDDVGADRGEGESTAGADGADEESGNGHPGSAEGSEVDDGSEGGQDHRPEDPGPTS